MLFKQKKPVDFLLIFNGSAKRWGGEEAGACRRFPNRRNYSYATDLSSHGVSICAEAKPGELLPLGCREGQSRVGVLLL